MVLNAENSSSKWDVYHLFFLLLFLPPIFWLNRIKLNSIGIRCYIKQHSNILWYVDESGMFETNMSISMKNNNAPFFATVYSIRKYEINRVYTPFQVQPKKIDTFIDIWKSIRKIKLTMNQRAFVLMDDSHLNIKYSSKTLICFMFWFDDTHTNTHSFRRFFMRIHLLNSPPISDSTSLQFHWITGLRERGEGWGGGGIIDCSPSYTTCLPFPQYKRFLYSHWSVISCSAPDTINIGGGFIDPTNQQKKSTKWSNEDETKLRYIS